MVTRKSSKVTEVLEIDTEAIRAREKEVAQETDQGIMDRLRERFQILDDMTLAVKKGDVRAMIVSGPPGVGKSYGVETVLEKSDIFNKLAEKKPKYEVVKGAMSAIGLYRKLYEYSAPGNVVVFDDCDSILMEDLSLNILKGALDSSSRRFISWNTDSRVLRNEGVPDRFEFKGAAIFITNIKFNNIKSKRLKDHLDALESRCHYIDLEMDTVREKILRIKQIATDGMLDKYDFDNPLIVRDELVDFITENQSKLRELSLRTVLKLADLRKAFPTNWQAIARNTIMRRA
jgi:hypothetical protein